MFLPCLSEVVISLPLCFYLFRLRARFPPRRLPLERPLFLHRAFLLCPLLTLSPASPGQVHPQSNGRFFSSHFPHNPGLPPLISGAAIPSSTPVFEPAKPFLTPALLLKTFTLCLTCSGSFAFGRAWFFLVHRGFWKTTPPSGFLFRPYNCGA